MAIIRFGVFSLAMLAALLSNEATAAAATYCEALTIKGQVFVRPDGGDEAPLKEGALLNPGDELRVGDDAFADLAFDEEHNNVVRLESGSEIIIGRTLRVEMDKGRVFARLKALPAGSKFEVQTPTAVAMVRGSVYRVICESSGASTIFNYSDSPVYVNTVQSDGSLSSKTIVLDNLEKVSIAERGEEPAAPERVSRDDIEEASVVESGMEDLLGQELGSQDAPGAGEAAANAGALGDENPETALNEMVNAYEGEDSGTFFSRISDDFSWRSELEEFVRRDFQDYDGIRVDVFIKRVTRTDDGAIVQADWQLQVMPTSASSLLELRGSDLDFVFVYENGRLKLKAMRGANPLFGARSPEIASMSGVSSTITAILQEIEDTGSRESRQSAISLIAQTASLSDDQVPVNVTLSDAHSGASELSSLPGTGSYALSINVTLTDNPLGISLTNVLLEVTDSRSGQVLRGRGNVVPGAHENVITTDDSISLSSGYTGTFTFVLDPDHEFSIIDRSTTRSVESYNVV